MAPHATVTPPTLVSAGAGSGKTHHLVEAVVQRVVAGTPIERIAAVTFTEAAASELQDRVRAGLERHGLRDEAARVEVATLCTIHRFALTLIKRFPLAAGTPTDPLVLDELQADTLRRHLLADLVRDEADGALAAWAESFLGAGLGLNAADTPLERLQSLLPALLEKARSLAMDDVALAARGPGAADALLSALDAPGDAAALDAAFDLALDAALAWITDHPEAPTKTDEPLYERLRPVWQGAHVPRFDLALALSRAKVSKKSAKGLESAVLTSADYVARHPELHRRLRAGVEGLFRLAGDVMRRYQEEKRHLGAVDFEDMQTLALALLTGPRGEAHARALAEALPFIVVDEFQDTSPLQFRLFEVLRAAGASVRYVGDLKQGIYGFRAADSALFAALLDDARDAGRDVETLDRSRRSRPELVTFANGLFGPLFPQHGMAFDALTAENDYARGVCPPAGACVELVVYPQGRTHAPRVGQGALHVRDLLARGLSVLDRETRQPRPLRARDVAVLAFDHHTLARWADTLHSLGIPAVRRAPDLFETLEVQLARAWFAMIASARDRAAAAAVLLSELYGLSQRAMVRLTLARVSGSPLRALELADASPDGLGLTEFERRALARCHDDLSACRRALRQWPLPQCIEFAMERVDMATRLTLRSDPAQAAQVRANLAWLVAQAHALTAQGDRALHLQGASGATLENYLLRLERLARQSPDQPPPADDDADAVRLVTAHASKGMEYPVVVLDMLGRALEVRLPRVDVARPDDRAALLGPDVLTRCAVHVFPETGIASVNDKLREARHGERSLRQEWLRLFYVAVTRAREHLAILWPDEVGNTPTLRGLLDAPPSLVHDATFAWCGSTVRVLRRDALTESPVDAPTLDLAAWRAMADDTTAPQPTIDTVTRAPARLSQVSPSDLCEVADCPEVPRLVRVVGGGVHRLARSDGPRVDKLLIPSTRAARLAIPEEIPPSRVGALVHAAVERATLHAAAPVDPDDDLRLAGSVLSLLGQRDATKELTALIVETLVSLRAVVASLDPVEEPAREVPFAIDLQGTTLRGVIDLVVTGRDGVHVVDLKTHALLEPDLPRWAAYYRPQLDAYALAITQITGAPVAGRHLAVPAASMRVTLPGAFDPGDAAHTLSQLAALLATDARGPGRECGRCGWRSWCAVGRAQLAGRVTPGGSAPSAPPSDPG